MPACAASTGWAGNAHAAVRLIARDDRVGGGPAIEAGLEFRFAPGWHGYWRTPGDAGLPPVIDWSGSDNVSRADVAWPAPARLVVQGLQNSVYEGRVVLPVSLVLKAPGKASVINVSVGYAVCSNVCVPLQADLSLSLPAGSAAPSPEAPLIAAARAAVPGTPEAAGLVVVSTGLSKDAAGSSLIVELRSREAPFDHPDVFVEGSGAGLPGPPRVALSDGGRAARLTVGLGADDPNGRPLTLTVTDGARAAVLYVRPLEGPAEPLGDRAASWWAALASALFGGLILNLMPCVLPVLSIKLMGLVRQAGAGRRAMRASLAATALGVMSSFLALAAILIGLQQSGASLGWGIQFQQPWFLAGMASLTVLFAASLFDWVAIGLPNSLMGAAGARSRTPLVEAFLTGAFATLLATPCSAPFVGTAVGFALAQGPAEILCIFLCLGLGMALPYGAVAVVPGLVRWIPRPGPWMLVLRVVLGLLLLATAGWLLFVLWGTAGGWAAGAVTVLLLALLGLRGLAARRPGTGRRWVTVATGALVLASPALAALPEAPAGVPGTADWRTFDSAALPGLVAEGKTVLVDVTATWCLTCKVNELAALGRPEVTARLDRRDIVRMRADWSRPDPSIAAYLHRFARYGIPMDVVYGPGRPTGEPLPELLTPGLVLQAIDRASAGASPLADSDR